MVELEPVRMQTTEPRVCIFCVLVGRREQTDSVTILRERRGISLGARKNGNATGRGRQDEFAMCACSVHASWPGDRT